MVNQDRQIQAFVKKVVRRVRLRNGLKWGAFGLCGALLAGVALEILIRFLPLVGLLQYLTVGVLAATGLGFLAGYAFPVDTKKAILEVDAFGLAERVITAYGLAGEDSAMAELQKQDTLTHISGFDLGQMGITPDRRIAMLSIGLSCCILLGVLLPNPMEGRIKDLEALKKEKKAIEKVIKKEEKKLAKDGKLSEKDKALLKKELGELRKLIKESKSKTDLAKAIMKTDKKLQLMGKKDPGKNLKALSNALGKNDQTKELADAMKKGDAEKVKKLMEQLAKALKDKDPAELKKLAEALAKAAEELKDQKELSDALAKLAKDLKDGKLSEAEGELAELADSMSQMVSAEDLEGTLGELTGALRKASPMELAEKGSGTSGSGSGAGKGSNGNGGTGKGEGSSGVGNGSDPGSENQKPTDYGNGIGHRNGKGEGKVSDFEKVWTSKTVGGEGEKSALKGKPGSGGTTAQTETEKGISTAGKPVSYDTVLGEYTQDAVDGLSSRELPPAMEKLVRDYFAGLNE